MLTNNMPTNYDWAFRHWSEQQIATAICADKTKTRHTGFYIAYQKIVAEIRKPLEISNKDALQKYGVEGLDALPDRVTQQLKPYQDKWTNIGKIIDAFIVKMNLQNKKLDELLANSKSNE